jgi:hypothetical protein
MKMISKIKTLVLNLTSKFKRCFCSKNNVDNGLSYLFFAVFVGFTIFRILHTSSLFVYNTKLYTLIVMTLNCSFFVSVLLGLTICYLPYIMSKPNMELPRIGVIGFWFLVTSLVPLGSCCLFPEYYYKLAFLSFVLILISLLLGIINIWFTLNNNIVYFVAYIFLLFLISPTFFIMPLLPLILLFQVYNPFMKLRTKIVYIIFLLILATVSYLLSLHLVEIHFTNLPIFYDYHNMFGIFVVLFLLSGYMSYRKGKALEFLAPWVLISLFSVIFYCFGYAGYYGLFFFFVGIVYMKRKEINFNNYSTSFMLYCLLVILFLSAVRYHVLPDIFPETLMIILSGTASEEQTCRPNIFCWKGAKSPALLYQQNFTRCYAKYCKLVYHKDESILQEVYAKSEDQYPVGMTHDSKHSKGTKLESSPNTCLHKDAYPLTSEQSKNYVESTSTEHLPHHNGNG